MTNTDKGAVVRDGWVPFSVQSPPESAALDDPSVTTHDLVLVTNNIKARDRMGRMSHVWLLSPIQSDKGGWVGFTESNSKVLGLSHWKDPGLLRSERND